MKAALPLCALAAVLLIWDLVQFTRASSAAAEGTDSAGWPTVPGEITRSSVGEIRDGGDRDRTEYAPDIAYRYGAGSRDRVGTRVRFTAFDAGSQAQAQAVVARYPVGATVIVYYDSADPDQAVLVPGPPDRDWLTRFFGVAAVAAVIAAAGGVLWALDAQRRRGVTR